MIKKFEGVKSKDGKQSGDGWDTPLEDLRTMSLGGLFIGTLMAIGIGEDRRTSGGENWKLALRGTNLTWAELNRVRWRNLICGS